MATAKSLTSFYETKDYRLSRKEMAKRAETAAIQSGFTIIEKGVADKPFFGGPIFSYIECRARSMPLMSYGENVRIVIHELNRGTATVSVFSRSDNTILDWGASKRNVRAFFLALDEIVEGKTSSPKTLQRKEV